MSEEHLDAQKEPTLWERIKAAWDREAQLIVVSDDILNMAEGDKVCVMLEEILHAKSGYSDHTREFQNYIFNELTKKILSEQING